MEQEATYVGIDVAKAQVDVAVRPTDDSWEVPHDQKGIRKLVAQMKALEPAMVLLGGFGWAGIVPGGGSGSCGAARGRRQPSPGAGLCQGYREAGQDRLA